MSRAGSSSNSGGSNTPTRELPLLCCAISRTGPTSTPRSLPGGCSGALRAGNPSHVDAPIYTRGRARRSLIDTVAFRVLSQITTALALVIQVRGMSEHDFGIYSLLYTFIPVIGTLLSLGLEQVMQRYQPEYLRAGNKLGAAWLLRRIATGRLATNILIICVVLLGWNVVAPLFKLTPYRGM